MRPSANSGWSAACAQYESSMSSALVRVEGAGGAHVPHAAPMGVRGTSPATLGHRAPPLVREAVRSAGRTLKVRDAHSDEVTALLLAAVVDVGFVLPGSRPPTLRFV